MKHDEMKQEPVAMQMDVIVVNLVREGINKHRARELAEHFIKHTSPKVEQEPVAWLSLGGYATCKKSEAEGWVKSGGEATPLYTSPLQRQPLEGVIDIKPIGYHSLQLIFKSQDDIVKFKSTFNIKE